MATQQKIEEKVNDRMEKTEARIQRSEAREAKMQHYFRHVLHIMEKLIAIFTLIVLTIVVGLEFVRMLIDTTPANILEVLTVAITRHVILSHDDPVSNLLSVACIAGLFAIRRFLFRRNELTEEMVERE